jgi:hypothetical protein
MAALLAVQCNAAFAQIVTSAATPAASSEPATCLNDPDPKNRCHKVSKEVKTLNTLPAFRRAGMSNFFLPAKPVPKEANVGVPLEQ